MTEPIKSCKTAALQEAARIVMSFLYWQDIGQDMKQKMESVTIIPCGKGYCSGSYSKIIDKMLDLMVEVYENKKIDIDGDSGFVIITLGRGNWLL